LKNLKINPLRLDIKKSLFFFLFFCFVVKNLAFRLKTLRTFFLPFKGLNALKYTKPKRKGKNRRTLEIILRIYNLNKKAGRKRSRKLILNQNLILIIFLNFSL